MGRTNPTYRDALRAIERRWAAFRRQDQPRADSLFEYDREQGDAYGLLNPKNTLLPELLSINLERIHSLRQGYFTIILSSE